MFFDFILSIPVVVLIIIIFVLIISVWAFSEVRTNYKKLLSNLTDINSKLKKYKTQLSLTEMDEVEDIIINAKFNKEYYLKDIWVEFEETVEKDKYRNQVYNTIQSEDFFNIQSIIISNIKHLELIKSTPSILTALGLLGTFLAILLGLLQVNVLEGGQVQGIEGLINGLAAKFTSSIVALCFSIFISYYEKRYYSKLVRACYEFQRIMNRIFPRQSAEKLLIKILRNSEEQEAAMKSFSTDMSGHLKLGVQEGITPLIEKLVDSINEIKKEKQESSTSAISSMVSDFKTSLTGAAGDEINNMAIVLKDITSVMSNFSTNNTELENKVNFMISSLDETIKTQQDQFKTYVKDINFLLNSQVGDLQQLLLSLKDNMSEYSSLINSTTEIQNSMKMAATKFVDAGDNLAMSAKNFNQINSSVEQLKDLSEKDLERFNRSIEQWNIQVATIKSVENSISNILEKVHESLISYSSQTNNSLKEYLNQYDEQMTNVTKHFSITIQEFDETIENLNSIMGKKVEESK